ncbi:MAG: cistern family PEP-CTERM protein [Calothrix sp. C42_A2020_038]|nr:cistern family PEP-CTERM protein [Calothrix sp. C42_A2020_038]
MFFKQPITVLSALATVTLGTLAMAPSASAFIVSSNESKITIGANDVNQVFDIFFDGNVDTKDVGGLSSQATFKFLGFTTVGTGANTRTEAKFDIKLFNTSSGGITSRTSALGFDTNIDLVGVGNTNGLGNTRVLSGGLFSNDRSGSFPNQFGGVDVCFTNGNTCQGGSNGGVTTGNNGSFTAILAFNGIVNSLDLDNFGVRYQSIDGINNGVTFRGASGTGKGKVRRRVPEPTTSAAIGFVAISAFGLRKKSRPISQT